jgi:hypothetical protein
MKEFLDGFISAAKETPRGFFAPLIAIWRLFCGVTDSVLKKRSLNFIITLKPIFKLNRNFGKSVRRITDASQVKLEINQLKYRGANGLILFPRSASSLLFFRTSGLFLQIAYCFLSPQISAAYRKAGIFTAFSQFLHKPIVFSHLWLISANSLLFFIT